MEEVRDLVMLLAQSTQNDFFSCCEVKIRKILQGDIWFNKKKFVEGVRSSIRFTRDYLYGYVKLFSVRIDNVDEIVNGIRSRVFNVMIDNDTFRDDVGMNTNPYE